MSEQIQVKMDDGSGRDYDQALKGTLREGGDLCIVTKNDGTESGEPIVLFTFTVQLPSGKYQRVQTSNTLRNFMMAASALAGRYPEQLDRRWPSQPPGTVLKGEHRGVSYEGVLMEKFYLVSVGAMKGSLMIAGSEQDVAPLAEGMINNWFEKIAGN